ncbi:helix-turn-helix domain-containing protein [bacterium]|nr:helix-turn-helix domain-containing protein [bacterium]
MSLDTLSKDYKLLDLDENATSQEARRAYHKMKALYAEGSLATYSLMTGEEREERLDDIERAYMRISREITSRLPTPEAPVSPENAAAPVPPEPGENLGTYLKCRREELGLTLRDVAAKTRIRTTYLGHIENEQLADLPALVYLRGFVLEFAKVLGLPNPESITAAYLELLDKEDA